ncbi:vegetative cell wall protein gp1-like [Homarus americanus]|uniref:vegetative cell wall protein gp1-like n=1 Tax=Homarus americanus TaxID=6706 RepID=UPI001C48D8D3|nr:vegetative cell wall protein gp1-like [Homarus americanus]
MPTAGKTDPTPNQDPFSSGSNRDSLNLDDFEKVEADQLPPPVNQSARAATDFMDDFMSQVPSSGQDFFSNLSSMPASDTKPGISPISPDLSLSSDSLKRDEAGMDPFSTETVPSGPFVPKPISGSTDSFGVDLLASAPPPATDFHGDKTSHDMSQIEDFFITEGQGSSYNDFMIPEPKTGKPVNEPLFDPFSTTESKAPPAFEPLLDPVAAPVIQAPPALRDPSPEPILKREPTPPPREPSPPREPTPPPRKPSPRREPTPPPREPTPPPPQSTT